MISAYFFSFGPVAHVHRDDRDAADVRGAQHVLEQRFLGVLALVGLRKFFEDRLEGLGVRRVVNLDDEPVLDARLLGGLNPALRRCLREEK